MAVVVTHVNEPCELVPRFFEPPGDYTQQVSPTPIAAVYELLQHCTIQQINSLRIDGIGRVLRKMSTTTRTGRAISDHE